jgi:hypothetical protein
MALVKRRIHEDLLFIILTAGFYLLSIKLTADFVFGTRLTLLLRSTRRKIYKTGGDVDFLIKK